MSGGGSSSSNHAEVLCDAALKLTSDVEEQVSQLCVCVCTRV
jgi:hypothetical protein